MTKLEKQCKDMADVCELAHNRTVRECRKKGIRVNCRSQMECGDKLNHDGGDNFIHYTLEAQDIFEENYNHICLVTDL